MPRALGTFAPLSGNKRPISGSASDELSKRGRESLAGVAFLMSNADFRQRLPTPSTSVIETAWRLAEQQQPEQGLKLLEDLLNRDRTNIEAWLVAGTILQHYGEFAQAADAYRRVLALVPGHPAARQSLAMMLITMGALAEAESLI